MVHIPQTGLIGAEQALQGGLQGGLRFLAGGAGAARDVFDPFAQGGTAAFNQQAALAGAQGAPAQQQAFDQFRSSPGQQFLQQRGEQALLRNAAAIGGIGGGNVRSALQQQGIGFAQQDFANQFNRLGGLSQIGLGAAGQQSAINQRVGELGGQAFLGTGQALAQGRTRAGEQIAGQISGTGSALADLINQQGFGTAQAIQQGSGSLADILLSGGAAQGATQQDLATLLSNIAVGAGSQSTGTIGLPGLSTDPGFLGALGGGQGAGALASGAGAAISAFSDVRLKENIQKVGRTKKGINLYTWDWNEIGRKLTGKLSGFGVIAQELREIMPEAVIDGEWLRVDYRKVSNG